MGSFLTREQILGVNDLKRDTVQCPEWGGDVCVRELTSKERIAVGLLVTNAQRDGTIHELTPTINARLASMAIIDPETGDTLFGQDDIEALAAKSDAPLERIANTVRVLSKMEGGKKTTTAIAGESQAGPNADSHSG